MNDTPTGDSSPRGTSTAAPGRSRWRRPLIWVGVLAGILGAGTLLVIEGPRYAARYLADRYFAGVGIDVDGVKTIDIDLPRGEVTLGPVRFYTAQSVSPGEVGELGVKLSLKSLFDKQALLERVLVRNVDIAIRQAENGEIFINGVALRQILAEQAAAPKQEEPPAEEKKGSSWGAGIDDLGLRDINVSFTNQHGGTATLRLDHLDLRGFRSWEPDQAGSFVLSGSLNGVEVNASGTARPFAEKITTQFEFAVDGATIDSVEQWTGPLGFARRAGGVNLYARSAVTVFPGGRIEGTAAGPLVVSNIDVASEEMGEVAIDQGNLTADAAFVLDEHGDLQVTGPVTLSVNQAKINQPGGLAVAFAAAAAELQALTASLAADGGLSLVTRPTLQIDQPQLSGPATVRAEKINVTAPQLAATRNAAGALTVAAPLQVTVARPEVAGPAEVRLESLSLQANQLDLAQSADGKASASTAFRLDATAGSVSLAGEAGGAPLRTTFANFSAALPGLTASIDGDRTKLDGSATAELAGLSAELPTAPPPVRAGTRVPAAAARPQRFGAERVSLQAPSLSAELTPARTTAAVGATAGIDRLTAVLPGERPEDDLHLAVESTKLALDQTRATLAGENLQLDARLVASLSRVAAGQGEAAVRRAPAATTSAAGSARSARRVAGRTTRTAPNRSAAPATTAATASLGSAAPGTMRALLDGLDLRLTPMTVRSAGEQTSVQATGELRLDGLQANLPPGPSDPPLELALQSLRLGLDGLQAALRGTETSATGRLSLALQSVAATLPAAEGPTRIALQQVKLDLSEMEARAQGDDARARAAGALDLAGFAAELPREPGKPALDAGLGRLRTRIDRATFAQTARGSEWSVACDANAEQLSTAADNGKTASGSLRSLAIGGFQANSRQRAEIDRAVLDRLEVLLTRAYLQGTATAAESRPKQAAEAVAQAAEEGWKFRLGSVGLTNGGSIRVRDDSVRPAANFVVGINALQLQNVDSARPEERMLLRLETTINEFSEFALSGWASPFRPQPSFDLNGRLRRLELPPLSPYAAQAVGVNVESGRLSADVAAAANAGKLDGALELTLNDLAFSALSAADAERLSASVGVPIGTIVGLLQDDKGRIRLKLPVSGDLQNPSFDLTDAIRQTLTGALQAAVLAPFQLAFAPVNLIAQAASGGGMRFEPVPFPPGADALSGEAADQLAGLARVLAERDKLRLKVCGRSTAADLDALLAEQGAPSDGPRREQAALALRPVLEELASKRTAAVRAALIGEGRAQARQVAECRSAFDAADKGEPRVDVTL